MSTRPKGIVVSVLLLASACFLSAVPPWGFFGHKLINRKAVFTLPPGLFPFYKAHIDFLTEHAVDADKRRYATEREAVRHYIDLDHGGVNRADILPANWQDAVLSETALLCSESGKGLMQCSGGICTLASELAFADSSGLFSCLRTFIAPWGFSEESGLTCDDLSRYITGLSCDSCEWVVCTESISQYGILPYYLQIMLHRLTNAFITGETGQILKVSADLGHYLADAHVPLHTTENYNGQLTGQHGIHAFWESRLPELFATSEYDFLVGKAEYIQDPSGYFWDIVKTSHMYVDLVLEKERELGNTWPEDRIYCFEERNTQIVRTQCRDYATAFSNTMDGLVEERMRGAIKAVGDCWMTAWINAGQPDLGPASKTDSLSLAAYEKLEQQYLDGQIKGRPH